MNNKTILAYKTTKVQRPTTIVSNLTYPKWKLTEINYVPFGKYFRPTIYSLFSLIGLFKKNLFWFCRGFNWKDLVSNFLIIPAHFKWDFMNINSVQFTYVVTNQEFIRQVIGSKSISLTYDDLLQNRVK